MIDRNFDQSEKFIKLREYAQEALDRAVIAREAQAEDDPVAMMSDGPCECWGCVKREYLKWHHYDRLKHVVSVLSDNDDEVFKKAIAVVTEVLEL